MILTNDSILKVLPKKVEWMEINFCNYVSMDGCFIHGGKTYSEFGFKETLSWVWAPTK